MDCKSIATPIIANLKKLHETTSCSDSFDSTMFRQLIGSLLYLVHTRPEIYFAVSALSKFMTDPRHVHWIAAKHVLRYLRGMIRYGLRYTSTGGVTLFGYIDSDWVGSVVDRKSTLGKGFSMGFVMISLSSR